MKKNKRKNSVTINAKTIIKSCRYFSFISMLFNETGFKNLSIKIILYGFNRNDTTFIKANRKTILV